jgi:hypothetical protein
VTAFWDQAPFKLVGRFDAYLIKPELGAEYKENPLQYFRDHEFLARAPFTWMARRLNEDLGEEVSDDTLFRRSPTADRRYGLAR